MNEELTQAAYNLKEALENDKRVIALNESEKEMESNEEVMRLSYAYTSVQEEYNSILRHFKIDSAEAKQMQKKLYEAKLKLDSHPLVKKYNQCYHEVRLMYKQIQTQIFEPFQEHNCKEKR